MATDVRICVVGSTGSFRYRGTVCTVMTVYVRVAAAVKSKGDIYGPWQVRYLQNSIAIRLKQYLFTEL